MNGHQKPHGRGVGQSRAGGLLLALALVGLLPAAEPPSAGPLLVIEHALQLGDVRQAQPGDRRKVFLPPSVQFMVRPPYLDVQDQLTGADIALLGGARVTKTSAIDYSNGRISLESPHGFRSGDKLEIFATGPVPRGLTPRRPGIIKRMYYYVREDGPKSFYLHKREPDVYKARQTMVPLLPGVLGNDEPGWLYFVPQALERRRPLVDEQGEGEPPWEGILRRLKRVLESDATSRVKQEAKGVTMMSLALRARQEGNHAAAHRFFQHYALTNLYLPNPPVSLPEVLLAQAKMHRDDGEFTKALEKYYDAQKSLLARAAADERVWQWLNLRAKRGIADTFFADTGGYTEDVRQWAFKMGALEMERTHFAITDATSTVFESVVKTSRRHGLSTGARLRLLPLGTTHATVGIKADQPLYVKVIDDGKGDKFILLANLEDTRNPFKRRGRLPATPDTGKLFFLPYTAPASKLVDAARPNRYTDEQLGLLIYPRLAKLFAAAQLYGQIDTEVDDLKRVFGNLNDALFAGPRGEDLAKWRLEWRRWIHPGTGKPNLEALATAIPRILKTSGQLEAEAAAEAKAERKRMEQSTHLETEQGAWTVIFDHMHEIFANDSVPTSGIRIDLARNELTKRLHGLHTGDPIRFSGPLPITANVRDLDNASVMYVRASSLDKFTLHPSASEAANNLSIIDFNGTGPQSFVTVVGIPFKESIVGSALINLAISAEHEGEFGRALQYLTEYLARNPDSPVVPEALLRQGFLYRLMGQPDLAVEKFYETMTDATRLRSSNLLKYRRTTLMAQSQIADTYYADLRHYDEAIKFYQQLLNEPDEELALENTKYKLIRCLVRRAMELADHAADPAKVRENPMLANDRRQRLTTLALQATRFLVNHPRSSFRAQIRYLRATAFEQLGDEKNADKDFRTLIETPASNDPREDHRWDFWKTKAALDLADRMFTRKRYADAVQVYPVLLPHNPTLDAHIRIHQQIALCHGHLDNLDKEIAAWARIDALWRQHEDGMKDQKDILAVLKQQADDLKDAELETQLGRIKEQKTLIATSRAALTPRLELIMHMARAQHQVLSFRKQLTPKPAPTAPANVANTP